MQNLMELDYGWANLTDEFILTVVRILASPQSLINVCRPATAILKKLVEADPMSAPDQHMASSSKAPPAPALGSVYKGRLRADEAQEKAAGDRCQPAREHGYHDSTLQVSVCARSPAHVERERRDAWGLFACRGAHAQPVSSCPLPPPPCWVR